MSYTTRRAQSCMENSRLHYLHISFYKTLLIRLVLLICQVRDEVLVVSELPQLWKPSLVFLRLPCLLTNLPHFLQPSQWVLCFQSWNSPNILTHSSWGYGTVEECLPSMNQALIVSPVLQERKGAGEMGLEVKSTGWSSEDLG